VPLLVGQIETASTDDALADVVTGLDAAFIGTTDLSVDLGRAGKLDDPRVTERISEIAVAAKRASVALGAWVPTVDALTSLRALGLRYVLLGSDLQFLRAGLQDALGLARRALA
jgi:4-hydroxy-2-oxoheptanedioate aldolase